MEWRDFIDDEHPDALALEQWLMTLLPPFRRRAVGELDALLELAAEGKIPFDPASELDPNAQLKPVRRDPDLYELRLTLLTKKIRHYHAEPHRDPRLLVALHLHIKNGKSSQDAAISHARLRYRMGDSRDWLD